MRRDYHVANMPRSSEFTWAHIPQNCLSSCYHIHLPTPPPDKPTPFNCSSYQQTKRTHASLYIHMAQLSHKHKLPCKYNPKLAERRDSSFHFSLGPLPNFF